MRETIVLDDVIPVEMQDKYLETVLQSEWRFVHDMTYHTGDNPFPHYGFCSLFKHPKLGVISPLYESVSVPLINVVIDKLKLEVNDIRFNRSFLQLPLDPKFRSNNNGVHVDLPEPHYAVVYYMNDTDGDTILYEQTPADVPAGVRQIELTEHRRVTPKKGRVVLFDGSRYHCSTQPTSKFRCIINYDLV